MLFDFKKLREFRRLVARPWAVLGVVGLAAHDLQLAFASGSA